MFATLRNTTKGGRLRVRLEINGESVWEQNHIPLNAKVEVYMEQPQNRAYKILAQRAWGMFRTQLSKKVNANGSYDVYAEHEVS